jgi:hypothetical protein
MKIERKPGPVLLTLETQDEVDVVCALFNHVTIRLAVKLPEGPALMVEPFATQDYLRLHNNLNEVILKGKLI